MRRTSFVYCGHCKVCKKFYGTDEVFQVSKDKKHWGNGIDKDCVCRLCKVKK